MWTLLNYLTLGFLGAVDERLGHPLAVVLAWLLAVTILSVALHYTIKGIAWIG